VIAIIGDGSFQYSVQSLWTAAQMRLPILIVVPRNDEYCILKSFAVLEETPGVLGLDIPGFDIVSIAKGYGCDAERFDDLDAIKKAARPGPNPSRGPDICGSTAADLAFPVSFLVYSSFGGRSRRPNIWNRFRTPRKEERSRQGACHQAGFYASGGEA
jgi:hypothetical protein